MEYTSPLWRLQIRENAIPLSQIIEAFQVLYYEFGSINGNLFPILDQGRPAFALSQPNATTGCVSPNSAEK